MPYSLHTVIDADFQLRTLHMINNNSDKYIYINIMYTLIDTVRQCNGAYKSLKRFFIWIEMLFE